MPPIMGAVAFIMAQYLKVPYIQVVQNAIIPALLYYIALMATIHFNGKRKNLQPTDKSQLPSFWKTLKNGGHLLLSLVVLVYFLIRGYTAVMAAFWGILVLFVLSFIRKDTRITPRRMIAAFEKTTKTAVTVGMALCLRGHHRGLHVLLRSERAAFDHHYRRGGRKPVCNTFVHGADFAGAGLRHAVGRRISGAGDNRYPRAG